MINLLNIWDKKSFQMSGLGYKCKLFGKIKYFFRCLKWSEQRVFRGYADIDVWNMYGHLELLIPAMLEYLRDHRCGSPARLELENPGMDAHALWSEQLSEMIGLWRDACEDTCTKKNPYEDEYMKAFTEFTDKYGFLGEKLQTSEELAENERRGGGGTVHFMKELPEYAEIDTKYRDEESKLETYRMNCKDTALDLLKVHFYDLWD